MAELLYKGEVYAIIGAAMEVYNQLGPGFSEAIYQEAMEIEVDSRKISNHPQQDVFIVYKGQKLKQFFRPDFICYDKIIVEIKALDRLTSREEAQLLNYLKATHMPLGLLINFGAERDLEWKRMVLTSQKPARFPKPVPPARMSGINDPKPISED
ncbi:MAG TPA: GxxExxY protein [Anaerolineales bacterium]|nr:GxxExxY protein [Anaerolineales bacterium]